MTQKRHPFGVPGAIKFPYFQELAQISHPIWSPSCPHALMPSNSLIFKNGQKKVTPFLSPSSFQIPLFPSIDTKKSFHFSVPQAFKFPYFQKLAQKSHPIWSPSCLQIPLFSRMNTKRSPHIESLYLSDSLISQYGHKKVTPF